MMTKLKNFASKRLTILIIISTALGLAFPSFWLELGSHIKIGNIASVSLILSIVMLCMGTTLRVEDIKYVATHPFNIICGILMQYTIMPFSAFLIAKLFRLSPEMAFGLIMLGCVPGGIASNVFTFVARGDVALSVATTMCTTLLSPLLTPALMLLLAGQLVELSFPVMALQIAQMVLAPICIGVLLKALFTKFMESIADGLSFVSIMSVNLVLAIVVAGCAGSILSVTVIPVMLAVLFHFVFGFVVAYFICKALKIGEKGTRALALEVGIQNSGLAATLANNVAAEQLAARTVVNLPAFAVAPTCGSIVDQVLAAFIASYFISKDEKAAKLAAEQNLVVEENIV